MVEEGQTSVGCQDAVREESGDSMIRSGQIVLKLVQPKLLVVEREVLEQQREPNDG